MGARAARMMHITEPVTMLTNFALAAASLAFAYLLARTIGPANRVSAWLWCAGFITSAITALVGATYHGFALYFDPGTLRSFWNIIMSSAGATAGFMIAGCHAAYIKKEDGVVEYLAAGIAVTLIGFLVQMTGFRHNADFNHNDAYHVIQLFALYLFFKGATRLRDRPGVVT